MGRLEDAVAAFELAVAKDARWAAQAKQEIERTRALRAERK